MKLLTLGYSLMVSALVPLAITLATDLRLGLVSNALLLSGAGCIIMRALRSR